MGWLFFVGVGVGVGVCVCVMEAARSMGTVSGTGPGRESLTAHTGH